MFDFHVPGSSFEHMRRRCVLRLFSLSNSVLRAAIGLHHAIGAARQCVRGPFGLRAVGEDRRGASVPTTAQSAEPVSRRSMKNDGIR